MSAAADREGTGAEVVDVAEVKARARALVRAALDAGKVDRDSTIDAVRFQVDGDAPVWALRGAWEEARATIPAPAPPEEPVSAEWDTERSGTVSAEVDQFADLRPAPRDERPTIRVAAGELGRMIRETIVALGEHDPNLFQRGGKLVTIAREPERREVYEADPNDPDAHRDRRRGGDILTRPGTPRLRDAASVLLEHVDSVSAWERFDARRGERGGGHGGKASGEWVAANPDATTVKQLTARGDWPGIRPIKGILETPCIAPSGKLIQRPGWDEETGYVLLPSCKVGHIADAPTREHARAALKYLWIETCCDFPYRGLGEPSADDPDRERRYATALDIPDAFVSIAMLLTIFARPGIIGAVPGGLLEAAGQGSGKSKQIHVTSVIATGRAAGVATFPTTREGRPNEEELEKIIMGYGVSGARIVAFDNIRGLLAGGTLERALTTEDTIEGRILGMTGQHAVLWIAVMFFSGNNMSMSDDIAQRLLVSRLESPREDPRTRPAGTFRHANLLGWIRENRARCVRAALVILRAYLAARDDGQPVPVLSRGNFEAWGGIVASALEWAGGPNIMRAFPEAGRGGDEGSEAHMTLLRLWRSEWQNERASVILEAIFKGERDKDTRGAHDGLADVRAAVRALTKTKGREEPSSHAFGVALRDCRGKPRDGQKIECSEGNGRDPKTWRVVEVPNG